MTEQEQSEEYELVDRWGVTNPKDIEYAPKWNCPRCEGLELSVSEKELWQNNIAGFSKFPLKSSEFFPGEKKIIVFKCPKCNKFFWFHIDNTLIITYFGADKRFWKKVEKPQT